MQTGAGRFQEDSITVRMSVRGPQHRRVVDGIIRKLRRAGISCVVVEGAGGSQRQQATDLVTDTSHDVRGPVLPRSGAAVLHQLPGEVRPVRWPDR